MDLHSSKSRVDMKALAALLKDLGADEETVTKAEAANTAGEVLDIARALDLGLGDAIAKRAREKPFRERRSDRSQDTRIASWVSRRSVSLRYVSGRNS